MNRMKKSMVAAGLTAGLLGGGAAGAILGTSGVSGAQETTTTVQAESNTDSGSAAPTDSARPDPTARFTETLAPLVADGTITQAQADAVIAALAAAAPAGGRGGHGGPGEHGGGKSLDAAATALGITADELRTAIEGGQTIAQVAADKGVDVQTVIDAIVAERTTHLDEEVAAGDLTQEEADQRLADATTRITDMVNNGRPERPSKAPADAPAEDGSTTTTTG